MPKHKQVTCPFMFQPQIPAIYKMKNVSTKMKSTYNFFYFYYVRWVGLSNVKVRMKWKLQCFFSSLLWSILLEQRKKCRARFDLVYRNWLDCCCLLICICLTSHTDVSRFKRSMWSQYEQQTVLFMKQPYHSVAQDWLPIEAKQV